MKVTTTPSVDAVPTEGIHRRPLGQENRAPFTVDVAGSAGPQDNRPMRFVESSVKRDHQVAFEGEVIAALQAALHASHSCRPGARLDALAMALNGLVKKCSDHAQTLERQALAMDTSDDVSPGCATAMRHARSLAEVARDVAELVTVRALAVDEASIKALWESGRL